MRLRELCVVALLLAPTTLPARLTEHCNTGFATGVTLYVSPELQERILAVVEEPSLDAALFERLWRPESAESLTIADHHYVHVYQDPVQDNAQITAEITADPVLKGLGVMQAWSSGESGWILPPAPIPVEVTEYHDARRDRYFLAAARGSRPAPPPALGWKRTGEQFLSILPFDAYDAFPVYRFYDRISQSHRFTPDPFECGDLRRETSRWRLEGSFFGAHLPEAGACESRDLPAWRFRGPNGQHRVVTRPVLRNVMTKRGWTEEGLKLCFPQYPSRRR